MDSDPTTKHPQTNTKTTRNHQQPQQKHQKKFLLRRHNDPLVATQVSSSTGASSKVACDKGIVVLPQEDRCVATRGTFSETCFAHNSAHRILLETLSTDLVISFSRRSQIRQPNTPKPIQKPQKKHKKTPETTNKLHSTRRTPRSRRRVTRDTIHPTTRQKETTRQARGLQQAS